MLFPEHPFMEGNMSVASVSSLQSAELHLKNVKKSRRSIYSAAENAYNCQYPLFLEREKELNVFQEQLAVRVEELSLRHIVVSHKKLLEEHALNVWNFQQFKSTLHQINGLSGLLGDLETAFNGLLPLSMDLPSESGDLEVEKPASSAKIVKMAKGRDNISILKLVVHTLNMQMGRKIQQLEPLIQDFEGIAKGKEVRRLERRHSIALERIHSSYPSTPVLDKSAFGSSQDEIIPSSSPYVQFPFTSSSSSSSSSSSCLTSPPTAFSLNEKVWTELHDRNSIWDSMDEGPSGADLNELDDSGHSMHTTIIENPERTEGTWNQKRTSGLDRLKEDLEIAMDHVDAIGDHIQSLSSDQGMRRTSVIVQGLFNSIPSTHQDAPKAPTPITQKDRINSKTRTPPKSARSSAAPSGRSSPVPGESSSLMAIHSQEHRMPLVSFPEKPSRSCGGTFDWFGSCTGFRDKEKLTIDVVRKQSIVIVHPDISDDGDEAGSFQDLDIGFQIQEKQET